MTPPEPWPPRHLVLRTPRLELRPDDDPGLRELAAEALHGVHPPDQMPFLVPWTDADPRYLGRGMAQHFWSRRAELAPQDWTLNFLIRLDGSVIGVQTLAAKDFAVTREVRTGSWIGMRHQGRGVGTEMRAAVLLFAAEHLGATLARSEAFVDNAASHGVSAKLGYLPDGTETIVRRGEATTDVRLRLDLAVLKRPGWPLRVEGLTDDLRGLLGAS